MKIKDVGEFAFIAKINNLFSQKLPNGIIGIGDDCSVIAQKNGKSLLVSTDSLVENIHFLRDQITPKDLGYKTIAVNISDIAAMGGIPKYIWLSASLPANIEVAWLNAFLAGVAEIAAQYNILLLGGDTTRSEDKIFLNVAIVGEMSTKNIKLRSKAKPGDIVCVTDCVGDSFLGLECIKRHIARTSKIKYLVNKHIRPMPNILEGQFLANFAGVHAMIDLSDGIFSDSKRIQEASHCGVKIYLEKLPISRELEDISAKLKLNKFEFAAIGGEDYCLLATIAAKDYKRIAKLFYQQFQRPLTAIGEITAKNKCSEYYLLGKKFHFDLQSFSHFA